jgi:hypothetical protein
MDKVRMVLMLSVSMVSVDMLVVTTGVFLCVLYVVSCMPGQLTQGQQYNEWREWLPSERFSWHGQEQG